MAASVIFDMATMKADYPRKIYKLPNRLATLFSYARQISLRAPS
jgi:hypothetical protein